MATYFGGTKNGDQLVMPEAPQGLLDGLKYTAAKLFVEERFGIEWDWNDAQGAVNFLEGKGCRWIVRNGRGCWIGG